MPAAKLLFYIYLLFFASMDTHARISEKEKPLVLQWEVSHPRNVDQISIIFRKKQIELVTNTSVFQKGSNIHLGRFKAPLQAKWVLKKAWVEQYYKQLKKTVPLLDLVVKDSHTLPFSLNQVNPHAPILRIQEKTVQEQSAYFKLPFKIIQEAWNHKWTCTQCASYKKTKKHIVRTVKLLQKESSYTKDPKWKVQTQRFPKKMFKCITKNNTVECIDPQYGIFEL